MKLDDSKELDDFHGRLASFVKKKRQEKGWSQYALAKNSGCCSITIKSIEEHTNKDYKILTVKKVLNALDVKMEDLL